MSQLIRNRALIYKSIPKAIPIAGVDRKVESRTCDISVPPPMGGLIIKTTHASCDSPLRGRMRSPEIKWAYPAFLSGEPVETYLLARVQKSNNPSFRVNDLVHGLLPLQEYTPISAKTAERLEVIHNPRGLEDNLFLGVLGLPGLTAYSSVYAIGKRKKGETIFISSAARAVGKIVGQLAKHEGFTVIGSVGSYEKLKFIVDDLGFDGGFNYKSETAAKALPRLAPQGLDIYYDNVGGEQLEAALLNMRMKGRIIASGMISQYSKSKK